MEAAIINRGRGPEIAGTRITVYTILDYLGLGWHRDRIAHEFRLSSRQIQAAIDYIESNKAEVMAAYRRILKRSASAKNAPEIEAKRKQSRKKLLAFLKERKDARKRGEPLPAPVKAKNGMDTTGLIIHRGRGPEIAGTRITVYRILDFLGLGWHRDRIAVTMRLSSRQVQAAIDYIETNKDEVMADYQRILDRPTKNSPEIEAKGKKSRAKLRAFLQQVRRKKVKEIARDRNRGR